MQCIEIFLFSSIRPEESDYVVTGGIDDIVKVWAWRNQQLELRHKLDGHALGVVSVDTSSDGKCKKDMLQFKLTIENLLVDPLHQ